MSEILSRGNWETYFTISILFLIISLFQGGTTQMRFQPRQGKYLAAAGENLISILDVETQAMHSSLQVIFLDLPFFMLCSGLSKTFV